MLPPKLDEHVMEDAHFQVANRLRLQVPHAGGIASHGQATHCNHRAAASSSKCGLALDAVLHALTCSLGGGVKIRHDALKEWLARLLYGQVGQACDLRKVTEQYVPGTALARMEQSSGPAWM